MCIVKYHYLLNLHLYTKHNVKAIFKVFNDILSPKAVELCSIIIMPEIYKKCA